MGLHKLTAGDGYTYLTRQVAAQDSTERGRTSLGDYYDQRGESSGRWFGAGLAGLDMAPDEQVGAEQMKALFGEGRHPNADRIEAAAVADGRSTHDALRSSALGRRFPVHDTQSPFRVEVARRFSDWNLGHGQPWNAAIPLRVRAAIRSRVARDLFQVEFDRRPADARELSGFVARASRQPTTAVAGYDLTFSPVKSVSALWAVAPGPMAAVIEQAHHAAVRDTLRWIETDVAYTRIGRAGIRQVDVRGVVAAAFTHRDARSGDPDLHTHLAVSNKVQTLDGRWLALDGRVLHKAKVTASERYNTRLEAELVDRLGVRFVDRPAVDGKRPVREITGVDSRLNAHWSSRRAQIDVRRGVLAARFQTDHGRPPTDMEALALAQQANLETRAAKHEPRSEAEQRAAWHADAVSVLGSTGQITTMIEQAVHRSPGGFVVTDRWVTRTAETVVQTLQQSRATWQAWHVRSEAERRARASGVGLVDLDVAVQRIVDRALCDDVSIRLTPREPVAEPAPLRRRDGSSVYTVAGSQSYTSAAIMAAEQRLLLAARRTDGRRVDDTTVGVAVAELVANGISLNDAQAAMVRELACSGARLQVALAPAGSGKTTAMRVLARAWADAGGRVVGLAPSAQAAAELSASIGTRCDTLAKFLTTNRNHTHTGSATDGIDTGTLVIIDEASMAGTIDLAETVDAVVDRGGSVRLIGDHQQLASVAAGGILRDIAETVGAVTLSDLVRFTDRAEAAATLALRAGDPAAVAFYTDRGRVHVGDDTTVVDHAYLAWATDLRAGKDSVLLALTRDTVATLNERARTDRLAADGPPAREVTLADGTRASTGDTVITRRNNRRLTLGPTDWVKNGDRWLINGITSGGSLHVTHLSTRSRVVLPSDYVAAHVRLGYACTVHAAQGVTADTAHTVAAGDETRQLFYVAMSRGRTGNHVYLVTAGDGDPHNLIKPTTLDPPTAVDRLVDIVARDGSQHSAATTVRDLTSPEAMLRDAAHRYHDAVGVAAEHVLGYQRLTRLDRDIEAAVPDITTQPAYPTLRGHLALRMLAGDDVARLAHAAAAAGELHTAADTAAVIDWRIGGGDTTGPLPWLPGISAQLATDRTWGRYLTGRSTLVRQQVDAVAAAATGWTPSTAPAWARRLLEPDHRDLLADVAVWRAAHDVGEQDRRPTGPSHPSIDGQRAQRRLDQRIRVVLTQPDRTSRRWLELARRIDPRITSDPYWPDLADRFSAIDRAGVDIAGLTVAVAADRPLPDEQPAAALWWRLAGHLTPAAIGTINLPHQAAVPSPTWAPTLGGLLGRGPARRIMADPAWPALVGAVDAGSTAGWDPAGLLGVACDQVRSGPGDHADAELAEALIWRVALLTDPEPVDRVQLPDDPATADTLPPDDAHLAPPASRPVTRRTLPPSTPAAQQTVGLAVAHERRLLHLNDAALSYYQDRYSASWAPAYLQDRLGTDMRDNPRFTVGYAPAGWTSVVTHLRRLGADDADIVDAGLGRVASNGNLIDVFRDRLVFPLYDRHGGLVGFIGRRNPDRGHDDKAGPKYLNTKSTPLFSKKEQLFGLYEGARGLRAGATAALVEGPLDAIAITHATHGQAVGVAPLGTAFTTNQADQLLTHLSHRRVLVATDADPAGWAAAQRAYWMLAARDCHPDHLSLPAGSDPASLLHTGGPDAVRALVRDAAPLAHQLLNAAIDGHDPTTAAGRLHLVKTAGQIIGAQPPEQWQAGIDQVAGRVDLPPGLLHRGVIDDGMAWTDNPHTQTDQRLTELAGSSSSPPPPTAERWRHLVCSLDPSLTASSQWRPLADTLEAANRHGYDITVRLPHLARGLPATDPQQAALELRYRIIADAHLPPPLPPASNSPRADNPYPPPSAPPPAMARPRGPDR